MENKKEKIKMLMTTIVDNPYIPDTFRDSEVFPTEKQLQVLVADQREILFGGAAGGGKTFLMIMAALQYVEYPVYNAAIIRRTFPQLEQLIAMSHEWLSDTDAVWNEQKKLWTFPSGATLKFGHINSENDKYNYQGQEFHFLGFDELTQFTETQYSYVVGRLRKAKGSSIPNRVLCTANPGGIGHDWVKKKFIDFPNGRLFVPSKLEDNPHIDKEDYEQSLNQLSRIERLQLRHGDWEVRPDGNMFKRNWFNIVENVDINEIEHIVRYWDMAATEKTNNNDPDWTVGCKMAKMKNGQYIILDIQKTRGRPHEVEQLIISTAQSDGKEVLIYMEQEGGASGKNSIDYYTRKVLNGFSFWGDKVSKNKESRAMPLSAQAEAGNVFIKRANWNDDFLDEIVAFPEVNHDDQVDAASGAFNKLNETVKVKMRGSSLKKRRR